MRHIATLASRASTYKIVAALWPQPETTTVYRRTLPMEDLRRLLLLRLLVVLGPGVMLLWLRFGLIPPQPLPLWMIGSFLALIMLACAVLRLRVRLAASVTAG